MKFNQQILYDQLHLAITVRKMAFFLWSMLDNEEMVDVDIAYIETNIPVSRISRPYSSGS